MGSLLFLLMPLSVGVITFGLGLGLSVGDFRRVVLYPRAVLLGLVCQVLVLPSLCLCLCLSLGLSEALSMGMMLLALSPSGAIANLYTDLAKGDVALCVSLVAVNSVLCVFSMPVFASLSAALLGAGGSISVPVGEILLQIVGSVLAPIALGMTIRAKNEGLAQRLSRPVKGASLALLVVMMLGALVKERGSLGLYFAQVGALVLFFNVASMGVGYLLARVGRLPERQGIALCMGLGVHNGIVAIAVASSLGSGAAVPPAMYSLFMFVTAAGAGWLFRRLLATSRAASRLSTAQSQPKALVALS